MEPREVLRVRCETVRDAVQDAARQTAAVELGRYRAHIEECDDCLAAVGHRFPWEVIPEDRFEAVFSEVNDAAETRRHHYGMFLDGLQAAVESGAHHAKATIDGLVELFNELITPSGAVHTGAPAPAVASVRLARIGYVHKDVAVMDACRVVQKGTVSAVYLRSPYVNAARRLEARVRILGEIDDGTSTLVLTMASGTGRKYSIRAPRGANSEYAFDCGGMPVANRAVCPDACTLHLWPAQ